MAQTPADDVPCQDCGQRPWRASLLVGPELRLYLCHECANEALANREGKRGIHGSQSLNRLLERVFYGDRFNGEG